jgi:hypothetical protein
MELIETKTLTTTEASLGFTSIPQDFDDLLILIAARNNRASALADGGRLTLNDSTSDFTDRTLRGTGSAASSLASARFIGEIPSTDATANTFSNIALYIPNYTLAINKSFSVDAVMENNATSSNLTISSGLWANTAAITSFAISCNNGSLISGTTISVYGITKGSDGIVTTS